MMILYCCTLQLSDSDKRTKCDKLKGYIQGSLDFTLLRKTTFLLFCLTGLLQKFIVNSYLPHTVNWALAAGVPRNLGVWAVSTLSCSTIVCRIFVSSIADKKCVNRLVIYACGLGFAFFMFIPLLVFPGIAGTYLSVILFGLYAGRLLAHSVLVLTSNNLCVYVKIVEYIEESISDSVSVDLDICNTGAIGNNDLVVAVQR